MSVKTDIKKSSTSRVDRNYCDREAEAVPVSVTMAAPRRVVLLACGSFNPITNMHLRMFEIARDALNRTGHYKVIAGIISPVNDAYDKKELLSAKHRCAMIRLALRTSDWIRLDTWESEQDKWNETAKVLAHHREVLSGNTSSIAAMVTSPRRKRQRKSDGHTNTPSNIIDEVDLSIHPNNNQNRTGPMDLKLLCGADLLESFDKPGLWKDEHIEEIVGRYGIVCINRTGSSAEKFIYNSDVLWKNQSNIHLVTEWISNDISATKIRRALRRGESVKYLIQDSVIDYITHNNLYGAGDNKLLNHLYPSPNRDEPDFDASLNVPLLTPDITYVQRHHGYVTDRQGASSDYMSHQANGYTIPIRHQDNDTPPSSPRRLRNQAQIQQANGHVISVRHQPNNQTPPSSPRRPVTCMGTDVTNLVRRVRNMRVAITPETCV